jgi:hypothetical protein
MRLKGNPVRNIRSRTAICSPGLVPPGDFLVVDLREGDVIVVVGWVKETTLRIIKVGRLKDEDTLYDPY